MVGGGGDGTADNAKRPMALGEGGDKCRQGERSVKSCEAEQSVGRKVGDQCEIMGAENPECSGRQL